MNICHLRHCCSWLLISALVACTNNSPVHVDKDSHVNFANYHTFAWAEPKADDAVPALSLIDQRVHASLGSALQAKGYAADQVHPDVRVSYTVNVYERPKQSGMSLGLGAGGGSGNVGAGVGVSLPLGKRRETVAAMTVNVIDVARNEQVWVGTSELVLKGKEATDADVQTLSDEIMAKYPAQALGVAADK